MTWRSSPRMGPGLRWRRLALRLGVTGLASIACIAVALVAAAQESAEEAHEALFLENRFPSATTCKTCHPDHYREWSVSAHAYAQMSPVFNAFHGALLRQVVARRGVVGVRGARGCDHRRRAHDESAKRP